LQSLEPIAAESGAEVLTAVVVLAGLALVAEMLMFILPKEAHGSISSMPALAAVVVSPSWETIVAIAIVKALVESARRAPFEKAIFNVAQYTLSFGLAALVFSSYGGRPFYEARDLTLGAMTVVNGAPAFGAFVVMFCVNSLLVSTVVAISSHQRLGAIWLANNAATIGMHIVASPLIFLFAWAYVQFGPIAAAALWIPIVGIRQVHKANLELEQTNVELLDLMVKSLEARDVYTSGHSRRVQDYSLQIARALGLSERDVEKVGRAALLHDVGKINEKFHPILQKADRLSADEWATMREHPADGASLIATMSRLRELVAPVRHHHENWDGTGYPDGITGELIPLGARIIRLADTIDAMTTERPYRRAMKEDEVRAEILRCRGTQFDPRIVDRLLSSGAWQSITGPRAVTAQRFGVLEVLAGDSDRRARSQSA